MQFELAVRHRHLVVEAVALPPLVRDVHGDRTTSEEHPHIAIICRERDMEEKERHSRRLKGEKGRVRVSKKYFLILFTAY